MDVPGILQIITAATAFMAALGTAAVLIIKELRSVVAKVEVVEKKADAAVDDQNKRLDVIHDNGNAHLAMMTEKLAASEAKNEKLLTDVNESFERRIKELVDRLETQHAMMAPTGAVGAGGGDVQKIEILQPQDKPVPVVETVRREAR
jgi:hypothetical protein